MKRFLLLALLLPVSLWAANRSLNVASAPSQVHAGQSFSVSFSASTDASDGEQIGFFHGMYSTDGGASWNWYAADVNAGGSATRTAWITAGGAGSTIIVWGKIAFRGGGAGDVDFNGGPIDWGGSWGTNATPPARTVTYTVQPPPNQAPTVTWVQNPASAWVNQWFNIQARGDDPDGNLNYLWVWREWVPHAFSGGGNGWQVYSDPNGASLGTPGTITFQAQSQDGSGAASPVIYHTTTIVNRFPRITLSASPTTISFGQSTNLTSVATDDDGNLAFHGLLVLNQAASDWYRAPGTDHSTGWGNHPVTNDFTAVSYTSGATSGASSTRTATHRPSYAGTFTFHNDTHDGTVWASSDGANWAACIGYAYVTVNKTTPSGTFPGRTLNPPTGASSYTVQAGDLNAAFVNPYTAAVAAPSGTIGYSVVGPNTAVVAGTALGAGTTPTIRASYPGDANYNATSIDAVWTIAKADQDLPASITPTSLSYGTTFNNSTFAAGAGTRAGAASWEYRTSAGGGWSALTSTAIPVPNAGTYLGVRVTYAGDSTWNAATSAEQVVTINQGTQVSPGSISPGSLNYGTTFSSASFTAGSGTHVGTPTWEYRTSAGGSWASLTATPINVPAAGSYLGVRVTYGGDGNWNPSASAEQVVAINQGTQAAPAALTPASLVYNTTFNDATFVAGSGTRAGTATWEYRTSAGGGWTALTATAVSVPNAGSYLGVRVTYAGDSNWNPSTSAEQVVTIDMATQTVPGSITPTGLTYNTTFNNATFAAGSGTRAGTATWEYRTSAGGSWTALTGTAVNVPNAGSYLGVRVTYAGDGNWNASTSAEQVVVIAMAAQSAPGAITPTSLTYGLPFNSSTFGAGSGSRVGTATWEYRTASNGSWSALAATPVSTPDASGYLGVRVTYAGDGNWNPALSAEQVVTIAPAPISNPSIAPLVYTGLPLSPSSVSGVTPAGATVAVSAPAQTNTGTYATATITGTGNYTGTVNNVSWTINPSTITDAVIVPLTYSGSAQSPSAVSSVAPTGATVSVSAPAEIGAGTYPTATVSGTGDYTGTLANWSWTIDKANQPTSTISSSGTANYMIPYTATAAGSGYGALEWALGSGSTASGAAIHASTGAVTVSSVGTVVIKARFAGDANHHASAWTDDFTVNVVSRTITVTLAGSKAYDGTTASTGATASITTGALGSGETITYAYAATPSAAIGTYGNLVTPTIRDSGNVDITAGYTITYVGTYAIRPAPTVPSGLRAWYTTDFGVTRDGSDNVSQWLDASGNGFDLSQPTVTSQPIWSGAVAGGRPALQFAGGDRIKSDPINLQAASSDLTVIVVMLPDPTQVSDASAVDFDADGQQGFSVRQNGTQANQYTLRWRNQAQNAWQGDTSPTVGAVGHMQVASFVKNGTAQAGYRNSVLQGSAALQSAMYNPTAALALGGGVTTSGNHFGGWIAEVLVYNRALNDTERLQVENALLARYGLSATDVDADGLPDTWEQQFFGTLSHGASGDPDTDGKTNLEEYQLGLDPTNHLDGFHLPGTYQLVVPNPQGGFFGIKPSWVIDALPIPQL